MTKPNLEPLSVSEAFELYRSNYIVFKNQSRKTEENHLICGRSFALFTNNKEVTAITFGDVRDWKIELSKKRSQATVRNYIIKLRVVLAFLQKQGYPVLDPVTIPVPQRQDTVVSFMTSQEVARMIDVAPTLKCKAIISLFYGSGIRVSELIQLDKAHMVDNSFTIIGKGGKARLCFVDGRSEAYLSLYLATRTDNHPALFLSRIGTRMAANNIQVSIRTVARQAGIDRHITPHTLRHSFATNFLKNNGNMRYLQEMLGHSSMETTAHYAHTTNFDLKRAYESHHSV